MGSAHNRSAAAIGLLVLALLAAPSAQAVKTAVERLDIIERQLETRGLVSLMNRLEQLQQDLQEMRGELELQAHAIEKMQHQQRQQYLDIDQRLRQLDRAPTVAAPTLSNSRAGASGIASTSGNAPPVAAAHTAMPPTVAGSSQARTAAPAPGDYVPGSIEQVGEETEYNAALNALRDGQYTEAVAALQKFMSDYPGSNYEDNARYWLGEAYYVTRNFDRALSVFQELVDTFPQSNKVQGSRLKIGYIHYESKNWSAAREELSAVARDFPDSTVARQANERIQRMNQEGY